MNLKELISEAFLCSLAYQFLKQAFDPIGNLDQFRCSDFLGSSDHLFWKLTADVQAEQADVTEAFWFFLLKNVDRTIAIDDALTSSFWSWFLHVFNGRCQMRRVVNVLIINLK